MAFEIARRIIESYRQTESQRIDNAVKSAYQEALQIYQSEQAAREAAIKQLREEQKDFSAYMKDVRKARLEQMKGEFGLAKAAALDGEKRRRIKALDKQHGEMLKATQGYTPRELQKADNWSQTATGVSDKQHSIISQYEQHLRTQYTSGSSIEEYATSSPVLKAIKRLTDPKQATNLLTEKGMGKQKGTNIYNKVAVAKELNDLYNKKEDPVEYRLMQQRINRDVFGDSPGIDAEGNITLTDEEIEQKRIEERDAYLERRKKVGKPTRTELGPPLEGPQGETKAQKRLKQLAEAVYEQLRETDDTPYELTEQDKDELPAGALEAYNILQDEVVKNPLLVSREEEQLLDRVALDRQLDIYRRKQSIAKMKPKMASQEQINKQAKDSLRDVSSLSPAQQRFYATERESLELSKKSDEDLRKMGTPEQTGLLFYKQMFDPNTKSYIDGKTYQDVVTSISEQFENNPGEQLRALSAFNSRAMALQRNTGPIIMQDGTRDKKYLEALTNFGKKNEQK